MPHEALVKRYTSAWNDRDATALLDLLHPGAAYYDAFWRETCVGRDLRQYFDDAFAEEPFRYEQVGTPFSTGDTVIVHYDAYGEDDATDDDCLFSGVELLTVRDGKILTITDIYCNPDQATLEELATLESRRHGVAKYANDGLGALRALRLGARFNEFAARRSGSRLSQLTVGQLASRLDCSVDQLVQVVEMLFGEVRTDPQEVVSTQLVRDLLESGSGTSSSGDN